MKRLEQRPFVPMARNVDCETRSIQTIRDMHELSFSPADEKVIEKFQDSYAAIRRHRFHQLSMTKV
jgi:hypothetical protein